MPTGCESWPITVTPLAASGKGECREPRLDRNDRLSPIHTKNRLFPVNRRDCQTARPLNYENREEIVVYQQNAAAVFRGRHAIFELTHMVKTASCRAYPEKLSGL